MDPVLSATGLRPRVIWVVGQGASREALKELWFRRNLSLTGSAIQGLEDFSRRILEAHGLRMEVLPPSRARAEIKILLRRLDASPELLRLSRTAPGLARIERALREGRMSTSQGEELRVIEARLAELGFQNHWRAELEALASHFETRMVESGSGDLPFFLSKSMAFLEKWGWPKSLPLPEEGFVRMAGRKAHGLERAFWEAVSRISPVREAREALPPHRNEAPPKFEWTRYPTLDDAADSLARTLISPRTRKRTVILAGDSPALRRSLERALSRHGIPVAATPFARDLLTEESMRVVLLPLRMVAGGYEREDVLDFLRIFHPDAYQPDAIHEAMARGVRRGLPDYEDREGGKIYPWWEILRNLERDLGGRKTALECARGHLRLLVSLLPTGYREDCAPAVTRLQIAWEEVMEEIRGRGEENRARPARRYFSFLQEALRDGTSLRPPALPSEGVRVHRLGHGRFDPEAEPGLRIAFFGLTAQDFSGGPQARGDLWWTAAERDAVAGEFELESSRTREEEARARILEWIEASETFELWDAEVDDRGKEREDLSPNLRHLPGVDLGALREGVPWEPRLPSYGLSLLSPPLEMVLPPLKDLGVYEVRATALDQLSRCEFAGTVRARWKLRDEEDPGWEPWGFSRGIVTHAAAALLLRSRKDGEFTITAEEALDEALRGDRFQGLIRSPFARRRAKRGVLQALTTFVEGEREYAERSRTKPIWVEEGRSLRWDSKSGLTVKGQPDRIDEHPEGLFVIDYKTASNLPSGKDQIEKGIALQTPFYAIAAGKEFGKRVIGSQLLGLTAKGDRKKGIFFTDWNGPDVGKLTNIAARKTSANLFFDLTPEEAWAKAEAQIEAVLDRYAKGFARAEPKRESECRSCFSRDLCGIRRTRLPDESGEASE